MQLLHLGFQLHCPFGDEEVFRAQNLVIYQPFFAFLERNAQKYANFRVSLQVSGVWIELAEKLEPELIDRLKRLVRDGRVEILATPFYNSLSFFYDVAEFEAELWLFREKIRELFGVDCAVLACPDLMISDRLIACAESNGLHAILAGADEKILAKKSSNHLYEAKVGNGVKILLRNAELSNLLMLDFNHELANLNVAELHKKCELASLRGMLLNVFVDANIFARRRGVGVIKLLDELLNLRLKRLNQPLLVASDIVAGVPIAGELSLPWTTSWRDEKDSVAKSRKRGLMLREEMQNCPPEWLNSPLQRKMMTILAEMKPEVFRTEDSELIARFCRLGMIEQFYALSSDVIMRGQAGLEDVKNFDLPGRMKHQFEAEIREIRQLVCDKVDNLKAEVKRRGNEVVAVNIVHEKKSGATKDKNDPKDKAETMRVEINPDKNIESEDNDEMLKVRNFKPSSDEVPVHFQGHSRSKTAREGKAGKVRRVLKKIVIE